MPIHPNAVGRTAGPRLFRWDDRDTLLYALGVGAGTDELAFTTENSDGIAQRVLPTFGVIACGDVGALKQVGELNWGRLVHGAQSVRLAGPLPAAGALSVSSEIAGIADKGEGRNAIIDICSRATDPDTDDLVVETVSTLVVRGAGGFGGDPGPNAHRSATPDRAPDLQTRSATRDDQALLYRLSGDRNPLHSDPMFATRSAGFPRPILHGLCTYGFAGRALLHGLCDGDPSRFHAVSARFSAPVFPGEVLVTRAWVSGLGEATFETLATAADGEEAQARTVLADGRVRFSPAT